MHELRFVLEALREAQSAIADFDPLKRNHGRTLRRVRNLLLDPKILLATNRLMLQVESPPIAPHDDPGVTPG